MRPTSIGAQKIDGFTLDTYGMTGNPMPVGPLYQPKELSLSAGRSMFPQLHYLKERNLDGARARLRTKKQDLLLG